MGKLIAWNIMSLDGYFEGKDPWDLPTHPLVWGPELEELSDTQLANAEALLFGRKTYKGMEAYWTSETAATETGNITDAMNSIRKYVVSETLDTATWQNSQLMSGDVTAEIAELKQRATNDIYVFGSANLLSTLLAHKLVDEYRVCIAPVLVGDGNPLFKKTDDQISLELLECTALSNGGVLLKYAPKQ